MAISVRDIKEKDFVYQRNGYSIEEVDDFLDEIADQVSELIRENMALKEELKAAANVAPVVMEQEPAKREFDDSSYFKKLESAVRDSIISSERIAEQTRMEADAAAKKAVAEAKEKAEALVAQATADAESITSQANAEVAAAKAELSELREAANAYRAAFKALVEEHTKVLKEKEELLG